MVVGGRRPEPAAGAPARGARPEGKAGRGVPSSPRAWVAPRRGWGWGRREACGAATGPVMRRWRCCARRRCGLVRPRGQRATMPTYIYIYIYQRPGAGAPLRLCAFAPERMSEWRLAFGVRARGWGSWPHAWPQHAVRARASCPSGRALHGARDRAQGRQRARGLQARTSPSGNFRSSFGGVWRLVIRTNAWRYGSQSLAWVHPLFDFSGIFEVRPVGKS